MVEVERMQQLDHMNSSKDLVDTDTGNVIQTATQKAISHKRFSITTYFKVVQSEPLVLTVLLSWAPFEKSEWREGLFLKYTTL